MKSSIAPFKPTEPLILDPFTGVARAISDIVSMRTEYEDRCDQRVRAVEMVKANLDARDREGVRRHVAFHRVVDLAERLAERGDIEHAIAVLGHASPLLGELPAPLFLPGDE